MEEGGQGREHCYGEKGGGGGGEGRGKRVVMEEGAER